MNLNELSSKIDQLGFAWEQYKGTNDLRLKNIENKKSDPLLEDKFNKINDELDNLSKKSLSSKRPILSNERRVNTEYKNAMSKYLRKGSEADISLMQKGDQQQNGFAVSQDSFSQINDYLNQNSGIRQLSSQITISGDTFDSISSKAAVQTAWSDGLTISAVTDSFEKKSIKAYDLTAQPKITQRLLDDSYIDVESYIASRVADSFLTAENDAFIKGDGVNKPKGILAYTDIERIKSQSAADVTLAGLMALYYSLSDVYLKDAGFVMNRQTVSKIRTLKDAAGNYLWMPGLLLGASDTLLGLPLVTNQSMSDVAASSESIIFGNLRQGYQIVDRDIVSIQRDPFTAKPFVIFYTTKATGGDVVNKNAIKVLKTSV